MAKILVIEDNEQNMYLCRYILERYNHEVLGACSGREGIDLIRSARPDLVILDIQLPEMNGYEVAFEIKRDPEIKGIPVVAVTSHAMEGDREKALASGCEGYIEKPINPDTFIKEIELHLS